LKGLSNHRPDKRKQDQIPFHIHAQNHKTSNAIPNAAERTEQKHKQ
jgi:hypothetical protein